MMHKLSGNPLFEVIVDVDNNLLTQFSRHSQGYLMLRTHTLDKGFYIRAKDIPYGTGPEDVDVEAYHLETVKYERDRTVKLNALCDRIRAKLREVPACWNAMDEGLKEELVTDLALIALSEGGYTHDPAQ